MRDSRPAASGAPASPKCVRSQGSAEESTAPRPIRRLCIAIADLPLAPGAEVADERPEGLHADVHRGVEDPEQPGGHPQGRGVGHRDERGAREDRADQEIGPAPAEPRPGAVAVVADDGLDDQPRDRAPPAREPADRALACPEVLVDGAHVRHLQAPAELDPEEAEAHVPDGGKRERFRVSGVIGSGFRPPAARCNRAAVAVAGAVVKLDPVRSVASFRSEQPAELPSG